MVPKFISCEEKFIENQPRSFHRFPEEPRRTQQWSFFLGLEGVDTIVRTPPKITFDLPQFGAILPEESVEPARKRFDCKGRSFCRELGCKFFRENEWYVVWARSRVLDDRRASFNSSTERVIEWVSEMDCFVMEVFG
ncbi:hypothetical protein JTB14_031154 [Gonioctena quinquepunctata]|nr:hypothetical protein JTB14_031154 [Gonioctena quinquepunctata]